MADQGIEEMDQMVSEFAGITGVDEERARFYMQSSNWDLNIALETFYDQSTEADQPDMEDVVEQENPESMTPVESMHSSEPSAPSARTKPNSNIFSLSSYQEEKSDTEEGQQAYYAGGSKNSGQQILGPDKSKKSKNPTGELFDAARKHGAAVASEEETTTSKSKKTYFRGAGFKLGSDVEPSQQVTASLNRDHLTSDKPQTVVVKFWSNGFSIDSGPLRDFNDPANKNFLDSISKGDVPAELHALARNTEVHVSMEDHREEDYVKPKHTLKAFSGAGQMLGSPTPNIVEKLPSPTTAPSGNSQTSAFQVNESNPVTTIQIRLADGTRLVSKFNHDSTVGDIRNVVRNARPNTGNFNLMTTFPNKILTEDDVTLTDAKLLNAVIVQRMT